MMPCNRSVADRAAFLQRLSPADFATATGRIVGEVNKMASGGE